jgi:hypothetical protein
MQYPHLKGFLGLTQLPGYEDGGADRERGLLQQGLVLCEPQLVNGQVVGPFSVGDGGDSEGLEEPYRATLPSDGLCLRRGGSSSRL